MTRSVFEKLLKTGQKLHNVRSPDAGVRKPDAFGRGAAKIGRPTCVLYGTVYTSIRPAETYLV